jgi:cytidylate kinase
LKFGGIDSSFDAVKHNLIERDHIDSNREDSPLRKAEGAIEIDTSHIAFEDQVEQVLQHIDNYIKRNS